MSSTEASSNTSETPEAGTIDMKLEVVTLPVSDVDRAKRFYQSLGWRLDADIAVGGAFRVVQLTPTHSACSIAFGKGVTTGEPGSVQRLILAVDDIDAARADLIRRGIEVSGLFHLAGGLFLARTRKAAPTRPMPRSAIRMATGGCSRRSRRGCRAGSGRTDDGHRFPSQPAP
jgi:catechol 2,3-dioxygenase-like lactoylglutathione lyase family enzyme